MTGTTGRGENRAVSITVNYVIALALTSILISGLLVAGGSFLEDRQESVTRDEFSVLGEQLAAGIGETETMAATGADTLRVAVELPDTVAGSNYLIRVTEDAAPDDQPGEYTVTFSSPAADVTWTVTVRTDYPIAPTQIEGGTVVIVLQDTGERELALVANEEVGTD